MKIAAVVPTTVQLVFITVSLAALCVPTDAGATNKHEAAPHQLTLNNGKRWATDQALREGMTAIRDVLAPASRDGSLPVAQLTDIAKKLDAHVEYIVANCRLPPEEDANLHVILMDIMAGSEAMRGKRTGISPADGVEKIAHALDAYISHFDHPDWKALH